ncbi:MAG: cytochrome b/b6 domain-containing protein [Deltaproteobacteria bacterium]|nr:cytochrome b/b6 domain-containing protein [Deltaproteobacteria bacterium]
MRNLKNITSLIKKSLHRFLPFLFPFIILMLPFFTIASDDLEAKCIICHSRFKDERFVDEREYKDSVHGKLECMGCHAIRFYKMTHTVSEELISKDVKEISRFLKGKGNDPITVASCVGCHNKEYEVFKKSIHGKAIIEEGIQNAAFCTDCHNRHHYIKLSSAPLSSVSRQRIVETCARCHSDSTIASRYGLNIYVVESYRAHFHGKRYVMGSRETPNCAICHGNHDIKSHNDPESPVFGENKVRLCSRCHEGATEEFARAFTHRPIDSKNNPTAFYARVVMVWIIVSVVSFLFIHLVLDIYSEIARKIRKGKEPLRKPSLNIFLKNLPREVERMNIHYRIQHIVLFTSIFYLAASGFTLKYPDLRISQMWINLWGGIKMAGHVHRFGAVVLITDTIYHIGYIIYIATQKRLGVDMFPRVKDIRDCWKNIKYLTGISDEMPRFGRYTYLQKLNYWLVVIIVLVMTLTGFMYWFPTTTADILPGWSSFWIWGVAYIAHSTEALIALFFGMVWHFYNVHLKSRVFPMNLVWLTGKIPMEDLMEDHPLEFEHMLEEKPKKENFQDP